MRCYHKADESKSKFWRCHGDRLYYHFWECEKCGFNETLKSRYNDFLRDGHKNGPEPDMSNIRLQHFMKHKLKSRYGFRMSLLIEFVKSLKWPLVAMVIGTPLLIHLVTHWDKIK